MNRLLLILVLCLSGCAALNPLDSFKPKPQINAQVGKENQQEISTAKVETGTTNQKAETISNDTNQNADEIVNIVKNLDTQTLILIIVLAGAALPSFKEMYSAGKIVIGDVYNGLCVPIKGIGNFILRILGREPL